MCAPLAAIPVAMQMAMAAATVASGVIAAKGAHDQGKYQEKVAENNALSAKYAADDAMARGAVEEQKTRDRTRAIMGQQRAALAANGIDATSGTGSQLLMDSAGFGEFDALTVRNNAMKQAYGFNVQADNLLAEGKAAKIAGTNQAIGTLLTSGSKAYGQGVKAGLWGGTKKTAGFGDTSRYDAYAATAKANGGWGIE